MTFKVEEPGPFIHIDWCDSAGEYLADDCSCPGRDEDDCSPPGCEYDDDLKYGFECEKHATEEDQD